MLWNDAESSVHLGIHSKIKHTSPGGHSCVHPVITPNSGSPLSPGIPLLCFLVLLPLNIPWSQISVTWLGVVHFLACLSPQLGSVVYHLFMNHEGGEPVYHTLLKLDVCGICMINTLGETSPAHVSRYWLLMVNHIQLGCVPVLICPNIISFPSEGKLIDAISPV